LPSPPDLQPCIQRIARAPDPLDVRRWYSGGRLAWDDASLVTDDEIERWRCRRRQTVSGRYRCREAGQRAPEHRRLTRTVERRGAFIVLSGVFLGRGDVFHVTGSVAKDERRIDRQPCLARARQHL